MATLNRAATAVGSAYRTVHDVIGAKRDQLRTTAKEDTKGWLVCLAALGVTAVRSGLPYSFGLFAVELLKQFDRFPMVQLNWIGKLSFCLSLFCTPLSVSFIRCLGDRGYRVGGLVGTVVLCASCIASSFVANPTWMFLTHSLLYGLGSSLIYAASSLLIGDHFRQEHTHHVLATSIPLCGYPIGSLLFNAFNAWLLQRFGWRIAFRVIGLVILVVGTLCCWFFSARQTTATEGLDSVASSPKSIVRSPKSEARSSKSEAKSPDSVARNTKGVVSSPESITSSPEKVASSPESITSSPEKVANSPENVARSLESLPRSPESTASSPEHKKPDQQVSGAKVLQRRCCTWQEIKQRPEIVLWYIGNCLSYLGSYMPFVNLAFYIQLKGNFLQMKSSTTLTLLSTSECATYVVAAFVGDCLKNRLVYVNVVSAGALAVICIVWPMINVTFEVSLAFSFATVAFLGLNIVYAFAASGEVTRFPIDIAWPFTMFWSSIGIIVGPWFAGAVFDIRKSYNDVIFVVGAVYAVDMIVFAMIPFVQRRRERLLRSISPLHETTSTQHETNHILSTKRSGSFTDADTPT